MFDLGMDWARENEARKRPVSIENEGLKLAGEYFDFGHKRCAIIFPWSDRVAVLQLLFRTPYAEAGCICRRQPCQPEREQIQLLQHSEWSDVIAWSRFAHDQLGCSDVVLHGICAWRRRRRAGSRKAGLSGLCLPSRG